jgi:hypothetical protein
MNIHKQRSFDMESESIGGHDWIEIEYDEYQFLMATDEWELKSCFTDMEGEPPRFETMWQCDDYRLWITAEKNVNGIWKYKYFKSLQ